MSYTWHRDLEADSNKASYTCKQLEWQPRTELWWTVVGLCHTPSRMKGRSTQITGFINKISIFSHTCQKTIRTNIQRTVLCLLKEFKPWHSPRSSPGVHRNHCPQLHHFQCQRESGCHPLGHPPRPLSTASQSLCTLQARLDKGSQDG